MSASSASVKQLPAAMVEVAMAKAALRSAMVERLKSVDAGARLQAGVEASLRLVALLSERLAVGAPVALFAAMPTELPCHAAIEALASRHPILFPRVDGDRLVFAEAAQAELTQGRGGIFEPSVSAPVRSPSAVVLPGRAFDRRGYRLGRGAGHYDRALAHLSPGVLRVGFAYLQQVVEELPAEPHDVPVHLIVTEQGEPLHCRPWVVPHASPTAPPLPAAAHD